MYTHSTSCDSQPPAHPKRPYYMLLAGTVPYCCQATDDGSCPDEAHQSKEEDGALIHGWKAVTAHLANGFEIIEPRLKRLEAHSPKQKQVAKDIIKTRAVPLAVRRTSILRRARGTTLIKTCRSQFRGRSRTFARAPKGCRYFTPKQH